MRKFLQGTRNERCKTRSCINKPNLINYDNEVDPCLEIAYTSNAKAIQIVIDNTYSSFNKPIQKIENIFVKP